MNGMEPELILGGRSGARRLAATLTALLGCLASAGAGAAEATGIATATVVAPIGISATEPQLRFGAFSATAPGQTVTVRPDGSRLLDGARDAGGSFGPARFVVTGEGALTYAITLPAATTMTTGSGRPEETLRVSNFVSIPAVQGTLSGGTQTLLLGATVTTVAGQALGGYAGSFTLVVAYD